MKMIAFPLFLIQTRELIPFILFKEPLHVGKISSCSLREKSCDISHTLGQMTEREVAIGNGTKEIQLENSTLPQKEAENFVNQYQTKRRIPMPSIREYIFDLLTL